MDSIKDEKLRLLSLKRSIPIYIDLMGNIIVNNF